MIAAGIYVHIPFCARKCTYCNFNTTDFEDDLSHNYVAAVAEEIAHWGTQLSSGKSIEIDTIYFGGGTPSIIEPELLGGLVETCRTYFDVAPDSEITIEINPGTFSRPKIEQWRAAGINRASVGVQSFIDRELVQLSRTHLADDARRTIDALREAGFTNISLDLIAGLPDQDLQNWELNLKEALRIEPEHLSLYLLEVKEGTQLFGQIKRGLRPQPDDDLAAEMYRTICEATRSAGYEQYEISNFALKTGGSTPSLFRSQHNLKYWMGAPFYGMGCGAHSYDGRSRWTNVLKTETYIAAVLAAGHAVCERHELSETERLSEALFMGLRLIEGIDLDEYARCYGADVLGTYGGELARFLEAGLIETDGTRLRLTEAGLPLSNEVFVAFV